MEIPEKNDDNEIGKLAKFLVGMQCVGYIISQSLQMLHMIILRAEIVTTFARR